MTDFYDDAILDADRSVEEILTLLRTRGSFDRTLIIIYSDHAQGFRTNEPVPLLIRMPGATRRGRAGQAVQGIDLVPTILDVLGLQRRRWMAGQSLLREVPPCRPVFGAIAGPRMTVRQKDYTVPVEPFFSLGTVSLVRGHHWYTLDVDRSPPILAGGQIGLLPGASTTCAPLTAVEARSLIVNHLRAAGYVLPASYR
jgi:hypothetical protein